MRQAATILIIEDNEDNLTIAREILTLAGYQLLEARDVDTGLAIAMSDLPDLILMDMHLPIKDGYEATRWLKSHTQTRHIPVVAFTALAMEEDRRRAQGAGCAGVIIKPIEVDTFAKTVAGYLVNHRGVDPVTTPVVNAERNHLGLSHDLQAPLRKIQQCCDFIRSSAPEGISEENQRLLEIIERSTAQMFDVLARHF